MKRALTIFALAFWVSQTSAQDLTSKKGEQILPEAKDWGIGVEATPFLEYVGNFFGKTANNAAPTFSFSNFNQTITGKYFKDAQTAYRASLRIGYTNQITRLDVVDRVFLTSPPVNNYPTMPPVLQNKWKHTTTNIGLAAGIEKRKGKTRLQGYYGAELGLSISSSKDKFTYGNKLAPEGTPTVGVNSDDNFPGANNVIALNVPGQLPLTDARVLERKSGTIFSLGVRAFIGVEYFLLPKISVGGEFGWGLGFQTGTKRTTIYESIGDPEPSGSPEVGKTTVRHPGNSDFRIDTDNNNSIFGPSASLRLNFHF